MSTGAERLDNGVLEIHNLDVEQADVRVVITEEGQIILNDADKEKIVDELEIVLADREVERTENGNIPFVFAATHLHQDHIKGLDDLGYEDYEVSHAIHPDISRVEILDDEAGASESGVSEKNIRDYKNRLQQLNVGKVTQVSCGDKIPIESDTDRSVLGPPANDGEVKVTRASTGATVNLPPERPNENGAVYKFEGERSALFMGDVQDKSDHYAESWLIQEHDDPEREVDLNADILFVAHHGSNNATSTEFLDRVDPEVAVISSALDSQYKHPNDEVLKNLHEQDVAVYWTAGHGTIRTDLDEALTRDQTTDLDTTAAADLAALKHYCREQEVSPEAVKMLAPGNLPEGTPEWVAEAPMIAETSEEIADAAITNADSEGRSPSGSRTQSGDTVEEIRQTLEESPAAAHLRGVVQADRDDHVLSRADIERNKERYEEAKEAQDWEPTLSQRLRMKLPNRYGGMDSPYQDVLAPEDIDGPRSFSDIPEATTGKTAAEVRILGLYSPRQHLVEAEETADRAVATAENAREVCQELRKTHGAHKDFLYASETANAHEKDEEMDQEATVQQGMSQDLNRNEDRGLSL